MSNLKLIFFTFCIAAITTVSVYAQNEDTPVILENFKAPSKNFVQNGSFNKGLNSWHFFKKSAGQVVNEGRNNNPCYKISGKFEDHIYLYNVGTSKGWALNLKEGETYTLSVWFKADNVENLYLDSAIFVVNHGWTRSVQIGPGASTTQGWVKISKTFVAPEQTLEHDGTSNDYSLLIYWPTATSGTLWIDDIQVEEGSKATAYSDLWNDQVLSLRNKLQETYAKISKAESVLKKRFPNVTDVQTKFKTYLSQIEKVAKGLESPDLSEVEEACLNGENVIKDITAKASEIMFPVWFKNPYKMSQQEDFPPRLTSLETQRFSCYMDQTRNLGLMMTNLSGEHIDARISPQTFVNEQTQERISGNNFITVYNTPLLPGHLERNELFTDPLPEANGINGVTVPAGTTRQAIISFSTENLLPGKYKGSILLMALTDNAYSKSIPVEFEVKPVTLPAQVPVDILPWGGVTLRKEEIKRLGHNCIAVDTTGFFPNVDESGNLLPVDYTTLNHTIKESRKLSPNCKFMLIFSVGAKFIDTANRKGLSWPDVRLKNAWQKWLKDLFANLKEQGVSPRDFLIQVIDEPSSAQVVFAPELHKLSKEAVPGLQITATLTGWHLDEDYKPFFDSLDYVIPTIRATRNPELIKYFKNRGDQVKIAVYECAESGESLNPTSYYRLMPWHVWQNKLKGWVYWQRDDRNPNFSHVKYMSTVYPLKDESFTTPIWPEDKYIISRRWLAMEAGYQDYKSLYLLDKVIKSVSKVSDVDRTLIGQARIFLQNAPKKALALDDAEKYPRALAENANPDILEEINETALKLTADLLEYDKLQVMEKPMLDNAENLSFKTNKPTTAKVKYLLDGNLPWLTVTAENMSDVHNIALPKRDDQQVTKCKIVLTDELGKTLVTSPFIMARVSSDSVFPSDYGIECVIDGVRVPGAQYWPGKTWISDASSSEHWVALEWDNLEKISQINICWMTRGGLASAYKVQYRNDGKWLDLTNGWVSAKSAFEEIKFPPIDADAVKVTQKASGGNPLSPTMMGISELEVF